MKRADRLREKPLYRPDIKMWRERAGGPRVQAELLTDPAYRHRDRRRMIDWQLANTLVHSYPPRWLTLPRALSQNYRGNRPHCFDRPENIYGPVPTSVAAVAAPMRARGLRPGRSDAEVPCLCWFQRPEGGRKGDKFLTKSPNWLA
jgi:hypothetical protein